MAPRWEGGGMDRQREGGAASAWHRLQRGSTQLQVQSQAAPQAQLPRAARPTRRGAPPRSSGAT
eukprot:7394842-Alexandrium_andersonii.AAC.1